MLQQLTNKNIFYTIIPYLEKMWVMIMKRKVFVLLTIILILAAIVMHFVPCAFVNTLGSSIISSIMVSFIWQYYIAGFDNEKIKSHIDSYFEKVDKRIEKSNARLCELDRMGLQTVYEDRGHLTNNIEKLILSASKSVKLMGESLNSFLDRPHFKEVLDSALVQGINIDILLVSLHSDSLEERYRELGLSKDESIGIHKKALREYYKYSQRYTTCNLRLFHHHPKLVMLIIDDKDIYVQHYSYGMKGYEAPLYYYSHGHANIESFYCKIFDNVWNDSDTKEAQDEEAEFKK